MFPSNYNYVLAPYSGVFKTSEEISSAQTINEACYSLSAFFSGLDAVLLSIKFFDRVDDTKFVRPYSVYPTSFNEIVAELMLTGGCPFSKEAKRLMHSFEISEIDQTQYPTFADKHFFKEISNIGHKHIAVLPVMIGRGIALATVGLHDQQFSGTIRTRICDSIPHLIANFIVRFPEVGTFFEEKNLTQKESSILQMMCEGHLQHHIAKEFGVSEHTLSLFNKNAMRKINASNISQLIYRAIALGEIYPHKPNT